MKSLIMKFLFVSWKRGNALIIKRVFFFLLFMDLFMEKESWRMGIDLMIIIKKKRKVCALSSLINKNKIKTQHLSFQLASLQKGEFQIWPKNDTTPNPKQNF